MGKSREWSDEEKQWITDNLSYVPETGDLVWKDSPLYYKYKRIKKVGRVAGTRAFNGYIHIHARTKKVTALKAHRVVWFIHYGEVPNYIDHINGDRADNRIENLRATTPSLNLRNQKPRVGSSSKYRGVVYVSSGEYYMVRGNKDYKLHYIGISKSEKEAAEMYDKWLEENLTPLEREYAKTNKELGLL